MTKFDEKLASMRGANLALKRMVLKQAKDIKQLKTELNVADAMLVELSSTFPKWLWTAAAYIRSAFNG